MAKDKDEQQGIVATNRKAYHDYFIEEKFEAGIVLRGTEVKSLRDKRVNLQDSYAGIKDGDGVLCFNFDNIRYVTATHIGEWARDKFFRYALCPVEGSPYLWDPAPPAKRINMCNVDA